MTGPLPADIDLWSKQRRRVLNSWQSSKPFVSVDTSDFRDDFFDLLGITGRDPGNRWRARKALNRLPSKRMN